MKSLRKIKKRNLYVAVVVAMAITFSINSYASDRPVAEQTPPAPTATPSADPLGQ